jgi:hypothetical protein
VIRATAQKGIVSLDEAVLRSSVVNLVGHGSIRLSDQTLDVMVLAAPLTTADAVVRRIPLVRNIWGGSLVTIPIRVSGPLDQPKIDPLPPSAVGEGLVGIMERTLKLPFKIMEPIIPGGKDHRKDDR